MEQAAATMLTELREKDDLSKEKVSILQFSSDK